MKRPSRFLLVAVSAAAALWLVAQAIGVSVLILNQSIVVFGFAGVLTALAVDKIVELRERSRKRGAETQPANRATANEAPDATAEAHARESTSP